MMFDRANLGQTLITQSMIDPQYQIVGDGTCPDGTKPPAGYLVKYPQGFQFCSSESDMQTLVGQKGYFNPSNPFDPRPQQNSGFIPAVNPATGTTMFPTGVPSAPATHTSVAQSAVSTTSSNPLTQSSTQSSSTGILSGVESFAAGIPMWGWLAAAGAAIFLMTRK